MSAYSTRAVTRQFAIEQIIAKVYTADKDKLEDMLLEAIGHETLNNFWIFETQEEVDRYNNHE